MFKHRLLSVPLLGFLFRWFLALKNIVKMLRRIENLEHELAHLSVTQHDRFKLFESEHKARQLNFKLNMARALAQKQDKSHNAHPLPAVKALPNNLDALYIAFEDQFRGSLQDIRQQQSKYLPFLSAMAQNLSEPLSILDIGCGRGEWLALLKEHHYEAYGLDISQAMVDFCRLKGLKAEQGEVLSHLASLEDNSLHVISAFHVIEHLPFEQLVYLFDECLRVLKPEGKIIFETPNPENLTVGAYTFYLDPTHQNPLPPVTVEFIARQRGFSQVDIFRYNPREEQGELNPATAHWFCSPVDYAVVAEK